MRLTGRLLNELITCSRDGFYKKPRQNVLRGTVHQLLALQNPRMRYERDAGCTHVPAAAPELCLLPDVENKSGTNACCRFHMLTSTAPAGGNLQLLTRGGG